MGEPQGRVSSEGFAHVVRGILEPLGVANAAVLAKVVMLYLDHPLWAVWLPAGGGWAAVRPAGSRPPGPEAPMVWVRGDTAEELGARMRQADAGLSPPG
jgi:hypothetical protein